MLRCKKCGEYIPDGNAFCTRCGSPVEKTCPKCGSLLLERKGRGTSLVCSNEECDYKE